MKVLQCGSSCNAARSRSLPASCSYSAPSTARCRAPVYSRSQLRGLEAARRKQPPFRAQPSDDLPLDADGGEDDTLDDLPLEALNELDQAAFAADPEVVDASPLDDDAEEEGVAGDALEPNIDAPPLDADAKYPPLPDRVFNLFEILDHLGMSEESRRESFGDDHDRFAEIIIAGLATHSAAVQPGDLFCCIPGAAADGHDYVDQALEAGAVAVLASRELPNVPEDVPVIYTSDVAELAGAIAAAHYHYPSARMTTVGVTGTNGKTTVSWLIRGIFEELERVTGILGTIEYGLAEDRLTAEGDIWVPDPELDSTLARDCSTPFHAAPYQGKYGVPNTTPDGVAVQRLLAAMADRGASACVMECSSHGLDQGRCDQVDYDVAVFTNLSRDHLDYHSSMEAYAEAKMKLFRGLTDPERQHGVVNLDDPAAAAFIEAAGDCPVVTFSLRDADADVHVDKVTYSPWETDVTISTPAGRLQIITPLIGRHNVANVLAAVATGVALRVPLEAIVAGVEAVEVVPGRCELIDEGQDFSVIVDYAHTPDALSALLDTCRECGAKRLLLVFGAGGERDRGKRRYMGEVAHAKADIVIVTNDNPRGEDPAAIVADIVAGYPEEMFKQFPSVYDWMQDPGRLPNWFEATQMEYQKSVGRYVMEDRFCAIRAAIGTAQTDDLVVIAGKGHEDYQDFQNEDGTLLRGWFDDRVEARNALSKLSYLDNIPYLERKTIPWVTDK